jgi:hypothetical protein
MRMRPIHAAPSDNLARSLHASFLAKIVGNRHAPT